MASFVNEFISYHVDILWYNQLPTFGIVVNYWSGGDVAQAIPLELIWIEGTEDEEVSPGRYSHAHIRNADLPFGVPALGDAMEKNGAIFDVVRVNAYAYNFSTVILQERN